MTLVLHGVLVAHVGVACMPVGAHVLHVPAVVVRGAVPVGSILHLMSSKPRGSQDCRIEPKPTAP